ncbi:class I SAM-dependent methyltransferase [Nocardia takedensis]|uniref:class I SAM-dependent methyltransferase n=1 Tax=Nocardia takedensis TaxID=259390 RepID=UPI000308513B|nr:class I SAM-dependent methyltransferase [Nocardia takedensis]
MSDADRFTRAFETVGEDFDRLGVHLWFPIGSAAVEAVAPAPGDRVLDACCGTGASALPAARRVGDTGALDAVDVSGPLIEVLRAKSGDLANLRAHVADVTTWPGADYDIVQAVLGIFFFPDMTAGTEYLINRLRPGGRAGFTIWRRGAMVRAGEHLHDALAKVTGVPAQPRPSRLIDDLNEPEPFRAWLTERGLRDVTVTENPLRVPMTPDLAWLVVTGSGYRGVLADLDAGQVEAVRAAYLEALARDGLDELDATTLVGVGVRPA